MRKLILAAALAALATPALAQSYSHDYGTGNINPPPAVTQRFDNEATGSLAYAPRGEVRSHRGAYQARGAYQDPNIALQQRRDDLEY